MSTPAEQVKRIALEAALDEANAGRPPLSQDRDPRHLVRIICAWCGCLIRYETWPKGKHHDEGGEPLTSHGICTECARKMEESMTSLTAEEYWHEQRRLARIEEKLDQALEDSRRLEQGLAEQGQIAMELRTQVKRLEAAFAQIVAREKEKSTITN